MKQMYDITEVCTMLNTTSRTLRFYEQENLIQSTVIPPSARRRYSQEQVETIKNVLALRALGLSVKAIKELNEEQTSLKDAILLHRAELMRLIVEKQNQINLLEEVLHDIDSGTSSKDNIKTAITCTDRQMEIADICTDALIRGEYSVLPSFFSSDLKIMLAENALRNVIERTTAPIGKFIRKGEPKRDDSKPNIVLYPLHYEKMIYRLKYVFHGDIIFGFWTDYQ